mmetsp:Transcript_11117/g.34315  ORF Transcript_11117/g.34315 Transcript_11117/m.34315 type:complete len:179 (-) Transcript_11117:367-903(-)
MIGPPRLFKTLHRASHQLRLTPRRQSWPPQPLPLPRLPHVRIRLVTLHRPMRVEQPPTPPPLRFPMPHRDSVTTADILQPLQTHPWAASMLAARRRTVARRRAVCLPFWVTASRTGELVSSGGHPGGSTKRHPPLKRIATGERRLTDLRQMGQITGERGDCTAGRVGRHGEIVDALHR